MKSEKAEAYINSHAKRAEECCCEVPTYIGQIVLPVVRVIRAVELAERDTEARMLEKAYKIILDMMTMTGFHGDVPRNIATEFIKRMSDDE